MEPVLDPMALAFQAIVLMVSFVLGGVLVVRLFSLMLFHEISVFEFIGFLTAFMGLLAAGVVMQGTVWMYLFLLGAFLLASAGIGTPTVVDFLGSRKLRRADIRDFLAQIERYPQIPHAYVRLGDIFFESRDWALAAQFYEQAEALRKDPHTTYRLQKSRERIAIGKGPTVQCKGCGRLNPSGLRACLYCGHALPGLHDLLGPLAGARARSSLLLTSLLFLASGIYLSLSVSGHAFWKGLLLLAGVAVGIAYLAVVTSVASPRHLQLLAKQTDKGKAPTGSERAEPQASVLDGIEEDPPEDDQ
jgi:hypothetical protein